MTHVYAQKVVPDGKGGRRVTFEKLARQSSTVLPSPSLRLGEFAGMNL